MLYELHRESYHDAAMILNPLTHHAAIGSILSGLTYSPIYVDSRDEPSFALTWTESRIFLSGEPGDEDKRRAAETIYTKMKLDKLRRGAKYFVIYVDPRMPQPNFLELLDKVKIQSNTRNYYELDARTREWGEASIDGLRLEFIDRRFLSKPYKNLDQVEDEMCSERSSVEEFLEKSVGVCGVIGDDVVSWCMSEYNHSDRYEIGIATIEEHRRRGIATITADTLMKRCLEHGFSRVGWDCWKRNEPSNRTALKLGFSFVENYPVYVLEVES